MLAVTADGRGVVRVDAYTPYGGRIGWLREYLATRFEKQLLILQRLFVVAKSADAAHLAWTTFWFVASAIAVYATLRKLIREDSTPQVHEVHPFGGKSSRLCFRRGTERHLRKFIVYPEQDQ
jgi:hypothetical protein